MDWKDQARELRGNGLSYKAIAHEVEKPYVAVWKALNPERNALHEKKRRPAKVRWAYEASKGCEYCGGRTSSPRITTCRGCADDFRAYRYPIIHDLWNRGMTAREIATELNAAPATIKSSISNMRRLGWDLEWRRPGLRAEAWVPSA